MTTPNEELRKLADTYADCALRVATGQTDRPEAIAVEARAALTNALQSQAERIKELEVDFVRLEETAQKFCVRNAFVEAERDTLRAQIADAELHTKQVERGLDKATAQLAEIEKTEPVAWINLAASSKMFRFLAPTEEDGTVVKDWQPLFTRPMPAESKDAERYRWLRDYLISPNTHFDDLIVSADKADTLDCVIDEALMAAEKAREE